MPVSFDCALLESRKADVLAAIAGRKGQQRKSEVADQFDGFMRARSNNRRGWATAAPMDVFEWACWLDTEGEGVTLVHVFTCAGVGSLEETHCVVGGGCSRRYAAKALEKGRISKLRMAMVESLGKSAERDPIAQQGNPVSSRLVRDYLKHDTEEQRQVGVPVKQAPPMLSHRLERLIGYMRRQAQYGKTPADRMRVTRDVALFCAAFHTMRRGFDLPHTLASRVVQLPHGEGLIFNFHFGKTLRSAAAEAVAVRRDHECPEICPVRAVREYHQAALAIDWDLSQGHLFPSITSTGERGPTLPAAKMTVNLQTYMRRAKLFDQSYTMHSSRVGGALSQDLAGTPVDAIMRLVGWKTRSVVERYIGATTSQGNPRSETSEDAARTRGCLRQAAYGTGIRPSEPVAVDTGVPERLCRFQVNCVEGIEEKGPIESMGRTKAAGNT